MGRKSLAEKYFMETEDGPSDGSTWVVLYDFKGVKPSSKFWYNLKRLAGLAGDGSLVQYSVFMTQSRRGALTSVKLARHYRGDVLLFNGEIVELQ